MSDTLDNLKINGWTREALRTIRALRAEGAIEVDVLIEGHQVRAVFAGPPRKAAESIAEAIEQVVEPEPEPELTPEERQRREEELAYYSAD